MGQLYNIIAAAAAAAVFGKKVTEICVTLKPRLTSLTATVAEVGVLEHLKCVEHGQHDQIAPHHHATV